jgi:broad specificity phosphatase PhoE
MPTVMPTVTRWWWIRHAPVTDDGGRVYGQRDVACDCSDRPAFERLARMLPPSAVWVTSHLKRALDTARCIVEAGAALEAGLAAPPPIVEPDLAEQHLGDWQGQLRAEIFARNPDKRGFWLAPAEAVPPGGESFVQLTARVEAAIGRLGRAHAGRDIVAVAHGGTIRAALALALGIAPATALAFTTDNLALTRIDQIGQAEGDAWRVVAVNIPIRSSTPAVAAALA